MGTRLLPGLPFLSLLMGLSAFADGTTVLPPLTGARPGPDPVISWNSPDFMECGLRCIYLESVEKISIEARGTLEKLVQLQNALATAGGDIHKVGDTKSMAAINEILPDICRSNESANGCTVRW